VRGGERSAGGWGKEGGIYGVWGGIVWWRGINDSIECRAGFLWWENACVADYVGFP